MYLSQKAGFENRQILKISSVKNPRCPKEALPTRYFGNFVFLRNAGGESQEGLQIPIPKNVIAQDRFCAAGSQNQLPGMG
jgi:hypothetical protein